MYKNILLTVDLNEASSWEKALPTAVECARTFGAKLTVTTVLPDFGMPAVGTYFPEDFEEKAMADLEKKLAAFCAEQVPKGVDVDHVVRNGGIYEEILAVAKERRCDLIVMASHRPELKDYLLGPNAARVVRHANCSVMVVRQ